MWLVLCEPGDLSALWAYQGLRARGLEPMALLAPQMLVSSRRWEHRLGASGASISIELPDGGTLEGRAVRGVLSRVAWLAPSLFPQAAAQDLTYAVQEMTALFLSWLSVLRAPVLNRPSAQGLCGSWRHPSEWAVLAARAGLAAFPYRQSGRVAPPVGGRLALVRGPVRTVFIVAGRLVGPPLPPELEECCRRLASLSGMELAGLEFADGPAGPWTFLGASPQPDLRLGGAPLLDALAAVFRGESP
jgi:hypothetical protein